MSRRSAPRVLVVCRDAALETRLHKELDGPPDLHIEFVTAAEYARRSLNGGTASDVIVLDPSATAPDGFDVYRVLQPRSAAPALVVLRARSATRDVAGTRWTAGGGMEALEHRLHNALGRTMARFTWLPVRHAGPRLHASFPGTQVQVDGAAVDLSRREAELLALLLAHLNRIVSREILIAELWGYETRSLDVYIRRLRRKLGPAGAQIETVTGLGYRFVEPAPHDAPAPPSADSAA